MNVLINPNKLSGEVVVPPSKSLCHRAIIAASLACGKSTIQNISYSEDVIATINAVKAFGASVEEYSNYLVITGSKVKRINDMIDANESGSTIRFMIPILLTLDEKITFTGKNNLVNRPLDSYIELFDKFNIKYGKGNTQLPLTVYNGIKAGIYEVRGDVSSQFITGLLFALPLLKGDSKIVITTKLESKGYIDLTIDVLKKYKIEIINNNYEEFFIKGNQEYLPTDYYVEGDYSQAAFWLVAGTLGSNLKIQGMNEKSSQGDIKIIKDIIDFKGNITFEDKTLISYPSLTKSTTIDFSQSPDLGPILTVLASVSEGTTTFINASRLRLKECDRITCMKEELNKMGACITELPDGMIINGVKELHGSLELDSHNDHRIAMALAIASTVCNEPIKIKNASCINKSYPDFYEVFNSLKGEVIYEE